MLLGLFPDWKCVSVSGPLSSGEVHSLSHMLSLAEVAEKIGVSRQAVRASVMWMRREMLKGG